MAFFFNKIYLQYVNTLTAVLDNTEIVPGQPISCRTLAVRGGHGTTWSGYGRYSSEKNSSFLFVRQTMTIHRNHAHLPGTQTGLLEM
jgi:hypothetical protein